MTPGGGLEGLRDRVDGDLVATLFPRDNVERLVLPSGGANNRRVLATVEYLRLTGLSPADRPPPCGS